MRKSRLGFTLVEAMIVVSVILILAVIAIPNMMRSRLQAHEAVTQANLKLISSALENYAAINSVYPSLTDDVMLVTPPYLSTDYFTGVHAGYTYSHSLSSYSYLISAFPNTATPGSSSFTVTTGGIIKKY